MGMTIDGAIAHAREVAKRRMAEYENHYDKDAHYPMQCKKCAEEHIQLAEWLEELKQYREIGTVEECRTAVEKQAEILTVDKAKTIAAKAICIGCGYLTGSECNYKGGNCMTSKPMLESVSKSFDDWNKRTNDADRD